MKNIFYILLYIYLILCTGLHSKDIQYSDLQGRTFVGRPVKEESVSGCEGCGEPGYSPYHTK